MEVKSILRNNTLTSINKKSASKTNLKTIKLKGEEDKENGKSDSSPFQKHYAFCYLRGTSPNPN